MPIPIVCTQCLIRNWRAGDATDLVAVANNRQVWRNLFDGFPQPYTLADAREWIERAGTEPVTHWAIEVEGKAVGGIGVELHTDGSARTGQFGYWLGEPYWGRGIATAAARAVADHVFNTLGLARLQAGVFVWNQASMRVLEKAGFVREGVLRNSVLKDGALVDQVQYARWRKAADDGRPPH